jgi:hypothetical protein
MTEETQKHTYGTAGTIVLQIPSAAFHSADAANAVQESGSGYVYSSPSGGRLVAPLNLPNGALVNYLDLYFNDTDAAAGTSHDVSATLFEFTGSSSPSLSNVATVTSNGASSGPGYNFTLISPALQINNFNQYMIYVYFTDTNKSFKGLNVWYQLQMSPAPASATFSDVPTSNPYFRAIEALSSSGITSGCGGGNFCPDQVVTRKEIAKFLANALGLNWPF